MPTVRWQNAARPVRSATRARPAGPSNYWTLHNGPDTVCGVMQMGAEVPAHWNLYLAVADAEVAVKNVEDLGGKVLQPFFDTPYGRMSVVEDPQRAQFCVIKLANS
jgi:predicted enzyme related to lactoylglutathione lyase